MGSLVVASNTSNRLDGVTINGDLDLSANNALTRVRNGLTLNGTALQSGNNATVAFEGDQTINAGTFALSGNSATLQAMGISNVIFGPAVTVNGGNPLPGADGVQITDDFFFGGSVLNLVNQGTISSDISGRPMGNWSRGEVPNANHDVVIDMPACRLRSLSGHDRGLRQRDSSRHGQGVARDRRQDRRRIAPPDGGGRSHGRIRYGRRFRLQLGL